MAAIKVILHVFLGFAGAVSAGADFVAPWFSTIANMVQQEAVGQRSSLDNVVALVNAVLWILYGASPKGSVLIMCIHLFGAGCHAFYLYQFVRYSEEGGSFHWILANLFTGGFVILFSLLYYLPDMERNIVFLSWIAALCRGGLALVPFLKLPIVYMEMTMAVMPSLIQCGIALTNSLIWTGFAITGTLMDHVIFWPSLVGIFAAVIIVILHAVFTHNGWLHDPLM